MIAALVGITAPAAVTAAEPATANQPGGATALRNLRFGLALAALAFASGEARPADKPSEVVASRSGFRPKVLNLRKGETVHLLLRTEDGEHCFAIDAFRIEKRILPGKGTSVDLTPDRVGSFPFYCCLEPGNEALRGRVVVAE